LNILIIDDDTVDRESIKRTLGNAAIECRFSECASVNQGLELLQEESFDAVLLDYRLPDKDGIDMLEQIKSNPELNKTAIVMISNSEEDELAIKCLNAGAQDFLIKKNISVSQLWRSILHSQTRFDLERKLYNSYQQAKELSEHDSLTGLLNRYAFDKTRRLAATNTPRNGGLMALLLIDIDNFKFINDSFGHDAGDELLMQIVARIQDSLRGHELFARLGGDEFAIILTNIAGYADAGNVAKRILETFKKSFKLSESTVDCSCSIGIAFYPDGDGNAEDIVKYADIAMYRAKNNGKNQLCFFEDSMQEEFSYRYKLEKKLQKALTNQDFYLAYQPIYQSSNDAIVGVEALIRWNDESVQQSPESFIPIAEESRFIIEIGRWVIEEAISQLSIWRRNGSSDLFMAINLSAIQLFDGGLVGFVKSLLNQHQLDPNVIEFELTESAMLSDSKKQHDILNGLCNLGCRLALDDFGTGYSSVSYLQDFPISRVKLDKTLTLKSDQPKTSKLMGALANMLHSLDLLIVAEGIETQKALEFCKKLGIENLQGFYLAKPTSPADISRLLGINMN